MVIGELQFVGVLIPTGIRSIKSAANSHTGVPTSLFFFDNLLLISLTVRLWLEISDCNPMFLPLVFIGQSDDQSVRFAPRISGKIPRVKDRTRNCNGCLNYEKPNKANKIKRLIGYIEKVCSARPGVP